MTSLNKYLNLGIEPHLCGIKDFRRPDDEAVLAVKLS
jgi:hypothetical protein